MLNIGQNKAYILRHTTKLKRSLYEESEGDSLIKIVPLKTVESFCKLGEQANCQRQSVNFVRYPCLKLAFVLELLHLYRTSKVTKDTSKKNQFFSFFCAERND